jgi:hypothetical protein
LEVRFIAPEIGTPWKGPVAAMTIFEIISAVVFDVRGGIRRKGYGHDFISKDLTGVAYLHAIVRWVQCYRNNVISHSLRLLPTTGTLRIPSPLSYRSSRFVAGRAYIPGGSILNEYLT